MLISYKLSHLPEVKAAIAAAGACSTIEQLSAAIHAFNACELVTRTRALPGHAGSRCHATNPVMVIGKSPAATETETGVHFSGPAGQVLRAAFDGAGLDLEACWISLASPWRPRKDNTPNASQLAYSRPFLFKEIELVQPSVILCLGEKATEALTQVAGPISDRAGTEATVSVRGRDVPMTMLFNHAFVMRSPHDRMPVFRQHLAEAGVRHPDAFAGITIDRALAA